MPAFWIFPRAARALLSMPALAFAVILPVGAVVAEEAIFVEATTTSGLRFVHFNGMSGELYFPEIMGAGGALFDADNDGDLDLYLVQGAMLGPGKTLADAAFPPSSSQLTDRLYRNDTTVGEGSQPVIRFTDVTAGSGLDDPATGATGYGMGVAAFDYDNDGWVDLYLSNFGGNQLWRNRGVSDEGRLRFDNVTEASRTDDRRWSVPALAFDYDRDGWLDLWVGNYVDARYGNHKTCMSRTAVATYCSPSIFAPVGDRLLRNLGPTAGSAGRFEDVTARLGLDRAFGPALGAIAADFDADGWLDLYVANDGQPNQLWINREGRGFSDEALLAGSAVNRDGRPEASMGVDAADFDGDGDIDLFMTHLSEETHTLYRNDGVDAAGGVTFEDVTAVTGLGQASFGPTGFGAAWLDYDNDGRLDLLAVNGAVKTVEALYRAGDAFPFHQPNQLFHQRSDGRYEDVTQRAGDAFQASYVSRGAVVGDVDNDGDPDVVVTNNNGPARLLVNRVGQAAQWLGLRLLTRSGRDALGARAALLRAGQRPLWRRVEAAGSYASSRDPRLLFGLGDAATIEAVQVHWPDGSRETWTDVATGRYTTLRQGSGHSEDRGHSQDRGRRGE